MSIDVTEGDEESSPYLLVGGQLNPKFEVQLFTSHLSTGSITCQLLLITRLEGRALVALPQAVWHRTTSQRLMVPGSLSRATLVEVLAADLYAPLNQEEDMKMRVWVGYLNAELFQDLEPYTAAAMCNHYFLRENGKVLIPFPDSLIAASNEHFAFFSAQEEEEGNPYGDVDDDAPLAEMMGVNVGNPWQTRDLAQRAWKSG